MKKKYDKKLKVATDGDYNHNMNKSIRNDECKEEEESIDKKK